MDVQENTKLRNKKTAKLRISLYGRCNGIQVGKDVIRILGLPPYLSIRVNKDMTSFLIESAKEKHKISFKVPKDISTNNNRQMVIISAAFVSGLMMTNKMDLTETYEIDGIYSEKNNAVVFNVNNARLFKNADL